MYLKLRLRDIAILCSVFFWLSSCVDDGYDLSDLDTDHLFVGDFWALPLGAGVIMAGDILDVNNIAELSADDNGDYVARYHDVIYAVPDGSPAIDIRQPIFNASAGVSFPGLSGAAYDLGFSLRGDISIQENQYMKPGGFERAEFNTSSTASVIRVTMNKEGFSIDDGYAVMDIYLPSGFEIDPFNFPAGVIGSWNEVKWTVDMAQSSPSVVIPVRVIDVTEGTTVAIDGTVHVPANTALNGSYDIGFTFGLENLDYTVIYGRFDLEFDFAPKSADIGGLYDIFEGDAVLSFRDPHVIVKSVSTLGVPIIADLEIMPDVGGSTVDIDQITLPAAGYPGGISSEAFWIGEYDPGSGYTFARAEGLSRAIRDARESLLVSGTGVSADTPSSFYPKEGQAELNYTLEIPFAVGEEFYAVTRQIIDDAFDGDIRKYLFKGGTAELYGTITNSIPLKFRLDLVITDTEGNPVGITFEPQDIAPPVSKKEASVSKVSFPFTGSDLDKMNRAANIDLVFTAYGIPDADALNKSDMLVLDLKLGKTGGIHISSDDDDQD